MAGEFNSAPEQGDKAADGSTGASAVGAQTHGAAAETSAPAGQSAQSEAKAAQLAEDVENAKKSASALTEQA